MKKNKTPAAQVFGFFSSYGLACILLLFLFLLTFLGTVEQADHGLFEVQKKYFESVVLVHWIADTVPLPLPGVVLILLLLAVNLACGGLIRIRKSSATYGILITHIGIAVLLAAGAVKLGFSDDGNLALAQAGREGELKQYMERRFGYSDHQVSTCDEFVSYYLWEIAIWDASQIREIKELIIPQEDFTDLTGDRSARFKHASLPFEVVLSSFLPNCRPLPKGPMWQPDSAVVDGYALKEHELAKEAEQNMAGLHALVIDAGGRRTEALLWGFQFHPWTVKADGKTWAIDLRKKRYKMPFAIRLDEFFWEHHPGTAMAKTYRSEVTKIEDGVETKVPISMNEPLRHKGYVLFQSSFGPQGVEPGAPAYSVFSVVRNPSDYWPLYACIIIGVGLLLVFAQKLGRYVKAQAKRRTAT